ncbi:MAG: sigma-70 family RNA polymerase sigma factor [Bacilli bacterium]|nr:sigma-70 family RNA polymerase sigma factor [Bacilli bacterium]
MEELLEYDGLIYSIISKYPKRYDREDLYQVAMVGLIDALKHYNSQYNTKFSSFAYYYIVGEVNKYVRENSSLKISKSLIDLNKKIIKAKEIMTQKLGRVPTNLEVSLFLEIDEELINEAIIATDEVTSIDDSYEDIKSDDNETKAEVLDLRNEINKLNESEKKLIFARYFNELTQSETSDLLGISQVQVSRNEAKILQKLKTRL